MSDTVYFLEGPQRIKVGYSNNFERRLQQHLQASFDPLTVIGTIPAGRKVEREIHTRLAPHKLKGEWYVDGPEVRLLVSAILSDGFESALGITDTPLASPTEIAWRFCEIASVLVTADLAKRIRLLNDVDLASVMSSYAAEFGPLATKAASAASHDELDGLLNQALLLTARTQAVVAQHRIQKLRNANAELAQSLDDSKK